MRRNAIYNAMLCLAMSPGAAAQAPLPAGLLLPVSLDRALNVRKAHPGQQISAEIMQNIPGSRVRRRAQVLGQVVGVSAAGSASAKIELRFDAIEEHGRRIPLTASLRAVASWMEVEQAQIPEESMDRGITPETATTTQIGGEQVYRGGGPVADGMRTVGVPVAYGVLARPRPNREDGCRGVVGGERPQAMWLFSTDACGVYGLAGLRIAHAGRHNPVGIIVLESDSGKLELRSGAGLLLRVE